MKRLLLAIVLLSGCARRRDRAAPTENDQPAGPRDPVEIVAADDSTCLRTGEGQVRCFGEIAKQSTPRSMDVAGAAQIVLGTHEGCAILQGGKVVCFGPSNRREVGIDTAAELSAYGDTTCARLRDGTISCFAKAGAPAAVPDVKGAIRVVVGGAHRCSVRKDGTVNCWQGTIPELRGATELAAGSHGACALLGLEHRVFCFDESGKNVNLAGLDGIVQLAMGPTQSCAVHQNGTVFCWGDKPTEISGLRNVIQVAVGASHACALRRSGAILCWGKNDKGQLGDGTNADSSTPVRVKL